MSVQRTPMTRPGYEKLSAELERLERFERPSIIKAIAEARAHGDLSENAEYHAAREKQRFTEGRINELKAKVGGAEVMLMNDLEAAGRGIATLGADDLEFLQRGERALGNRVLIAAGTGLGESILVWARERHRPVASEGGHADWAPNDALEDELLAWLRARYGHVSAERVLSGHGLADLYRFLSATGRGAEPEGMAERFAAASDPAAFVTEAALEGSCERAWIALGKWVEVYGAEAGNLALTGLALGGVFVGGGIAPRIPTVLRDGRFVRAFNAKGRLESLLERMPVALLLDARIGLWGAATVALEAPSRAEL